MDLSHLVSFSVATSQVAGCGSSSSFVEATDRQFCLHRNVPCLLSLQSQSILETAKRPCIPASLHGVLPQGWRLA